MHPQLDEQVKRSRGIVRRKDHPDLHNAIDAAVRRGDLVRLLPGLYATPSVAATLEGRARAVGLFDPDAVVTGLAAAALTGWDVRRPGVLTVASPHAHRPAAGFTFERRSIPRQLTRRMDGFRATARVLTALDVYDATTDAIEYAQRKNVAPADVARTLTLTRGRRGNVARRRLADQSRDNAWSPVERRAHARLRRARISGWKANAALFDAAGTLLGYGDLVFEQIGLVLELDGAPHRDRETQQRDTARDLALRRAGWEVIRFGAALVEDDPARFVAIFRDVVESRRGRGRGRGLGCGPTCRKLDTRRDP